MLNRLLLALVFACATLAQLGVAESTYCSTPVIIIPDGRLTQSTFPPTTYWYGLYAQAGHSYSVEFEPATDNYFGTSLVLFSALSVFGPNDSLQGCHGTSTVQVTQNSGYAPVILKNNNGAGRRVSFVAQSAGLYVISASNVGGSGTYTFRAVDTTLIDVRWNTMSGYDVQWVLANVSDMQITGTLTALDMNGQVVAAVQFSIPPGGRVARSSATSDVNLPRNMAGLAIFGHNGPPNSIMGEAFMIGATVTLPEKFDAITPR